MGKTIRVLQAEWSYLNDPSRLEALARKHLPMGPASPSQIVGLDQVPGKLPVGVVSNHGTKSNSAPAGRPIFADYKKRTTDD